MKIALCSCVSIFFSLTVCAQIQLSGTVVTADLEPVAFATVSVHPANDSTLLRGALTNQDGAFIIDNLTPGSYRLKVQSLGFADWKQAVNLTNNLRLPPVYLQPEATFLSQAVVVAERSIVENQLGKKVLRLGEDLTSTGSNALEALEMIPSVTTSPRGQVQIRGNANVVIHINGQATRRDPATLKFIAAESLERIEIITNPSAEYDAEGVGGIINLVYKKDRSTSFKVELISNLAVLTDPANLSPNGGLNISYTNNKISIFANLSHDYSQYIDNNDSRRNNFGEELQRYENLAVFEGRGNVSNALVGFSFEPDSVTSLGVEVNYDRWDFSSTVQQQSIFDYRAGADKTFEVENENGELENELWVNLSFEKEFAKDRTLKSSLSTGGEDEENFFVSEEVDLNDLPADVQQFLRSSSESESQRYYQGMLDYKAPFLGWGTIDVGMKVDLIRYNILQKIALRSNSIRPPDNDFTMDIQKAGLYVVQKKRVKRFEYGLGLRLEQFSSQAFQQADRTTFTQDYLRLFPSLQLNYQLSGSAHTLGFSYTRRINRPGFFDLNTYVSYEDPLNLETGNPALRPEIADLLELNYHREWNKLNVDVSLYQRTTLDAIQNIVTLLDANRSLVSTVNIGSAGNSGIELQLEYMPSEKIKATGSFVVAQNSFADTESEVSYSRQRTWSIRLRQQWELPKGWRVELSETYRAPSYQIQQKTASIYYGNLGLRKKLNNQRGSFSLAVRDVFNTRRYVYSLRTSDFDVERSYKWQTRQIALGFSYTLVDRKN